MKKIKITTYDDVKDYVKEKYNISIKDCWIAHMKEICDLKVRVAHNRINVAERTNPCPEDKQEILLEAFKKVGWID